MFLSTSGGTQGIILALILAVSFGGSLGAIWDVAGFEPKLATCKSSTLPTVLLLQPPKKSLLGE